MTRRLRICNAIDTRPLARDHRGAMEIEAPSENQKATAMSAEIVAYAETGVAEDKIISRMMSKGVPLEDAKRILPEIMQSARPKRRRRSLARRLVGGSLALAGFGAGIYCLANGLLVVWLFIGGIAGLAIFAGYLNLNFSH